MRGLCDLTIRSISPKEAEQMKMSQQCTASLTIIVDTPHCTPGVASSSTRIR